MVNNGELNVPLALRAINSVVAVQNALVPATPAEVTAAAKKYISSSLDVTTAAMRNVSIEERNRLNKIAMTLLLRSPMCADCLTDRCRMTFPAGRRRVIRPRGGPEQVDSCTASGEVRRSETERARWVHSGLWDAGRRGYPTPARALYGRSDRRGLALEAERRGIVESVSASTCTAGER